MKYYIIAGEASGDLHAANLMRATLAEMNRLDVELEILPQDAPGRIFG